jgi:hypothetical protein
LFSFGGLFCGESATWTELRGEVHNWIMAAFRENYKFAKKKVQTSSEVAEFFI